MLPGATGLAQKGSICTHAMCKWHVLPPPIHDIMIEKLSTTGMFINTYGTCVKLFSTQILHHCHFWDSTYRHFDRYLILPAANTTHIDCDNRSMNWLDAGGSWWACRCLYVCGCTDSYVCLICDIGLSPVVKSVSVGIHVLPLQPTSNKTIHGVLSNHPKDCTNNTPQIQHLSKAYDIHTMTRHQEITFFSKKSYCSKSLRRRRAKRATLARATFPCRYVHNKSIRHSKKYV